MPRPGTVTVRFGEPIMFESNQLDPRWGRGPRRAAVELLEQRIRDLSWRPLAGDVARLPEEPEKPEKEDHATVSVSTVTRVGPHTRSHGRS